MVKRIRSEGGGEGKAERRRTMPCGITPDSSGYPPDRLKVTPFIYKEKTLS